ncbi:CAP domain-containing protein [Nocardioides terrigena]|uniref:CAP domain-containing protein n=1 Tax=Nocardioides terrigena TaxID=424797 RepID=UPI0019019239|nr:CAP domain-containing protein [Nocardioides terrigena]
MPRPSAVLRPRALRGVLLLVLPLVVAALVTVPLVGTSGAGPRTSVAGWSSGTVSVGAGDVLTFRVVVRSPGRARVRMVRLQSRARPTGAWSSSRWSGTSRRGVVRLRWSAPGPDTSRWLRVQVRRATGSPATVTRAKRVVVAPEPEGTTSTPTPEPSDEGFAQDVLRLTNAARSVARTCGDTAYPAVPPVTGDGRLDAAADAHAVDMGTRDYFSHTSLGDGRSPGDRITAAGYTWRTYGENIAAGYGSPGAVVQGWLDSAGHCRNLMNPAFTQLGVGHADVPGSTYDDYWVQNFAAPAA